MSYQEKRTIVSLATGVLVLTAYCLYAIHQQQAGAVAPNDLGFWARSILIFIGIGVVASIVIQIVFHILISIGISVQKKIQDQACDDHDIEKSINAEMVEDEMDRLIEMKSTRVGFFIGGLGFVAGLIALTLNYSAAVMLNITFISFSVGSVIEGLTQLYYYRKGV